MNEDHKNSEMTLDLSVLMNLVEQLKNVAEKMGRNVRVKYY